MKKNTAKKISIEPKLNYDLNLLKDMYKKIKRKVAERILSTNKEKWTTVNDFYVDCDNLREDDNKMFSFKTKDEKLKFLDGINDYVMNLELKYQDA